MNIEGIKDKITKLNNFVLSFLLFYIGIGISSVLWKLNNITGFGKNGRGWETCEGEVSLERMKKLY